MSDYINREAALSSRSVIEVYDANEDIVDWGVSFDTIKAIPAADVAPAVRGRWKESDFIPGMLTCSNCGAQRNPKFKIGCGSWNFCPNCGAKMGG